jgi:hypothetical protein
MNNQYIFVPKNPILRHCSDSLSQALKNQSDNSTAIHCLSLTNLKIVGSLLRQVVSTQSGEQISLFFLAVQSDYLALLCFLKVFTIIFDRNINTYYLMHEPRLEKEQTNPVKSWIIFLHQFLFGYFSDVILLPSDKAVAKAETFVRKEKIRKINLTFLSIPKATLEKNLQQLKGRWEMGKTFSMLGTVSSSTKNPQGFLDFASIFNQLHPGAAEFIRGGRDRGINVHYSEEIVRFPCYLSEQTKGFLFSLSHFIIVPYFVSTQSGVIVEALSYGKILIVNDIPAFQHLRELDFVFVIDFSEKNMMLRCIHHILSMSSIEYERCYWSAIQYFQKNHSEAYLLEKIDTFL